MSDSTEIKAGDLVRRMKNCPACTLPSHQLGWTGRVSNIGWTGRVSHTGQFGDLLSFEGGGHGGTAFYEKVFEVEDERIQAWHQVASHPILKNCYGTGGPFIDAVIARLDELSDMEMTINELKSSDEDVTAESIKGVTEAPRYADPGVRLRVLELALAYGDGGIGPEEMVEAAETFAAWVEGR